jgi:lysine 6-dehydrogenase
MRVLVLGAGLQGSAAAYDLLRFGGARRLTLVDADGAALARCFAELPALAEAGAQARALDLSEAAALAPLLAEADAVFSALPYFLNLPVAAACARAGVHYVDLGGNTDIVRRTLELDPIARATGATLVPDCGLAPGLAATVAMAAIEGMATVESLRIRVGGLPQHPRPPLDYSLFFSVHGLINEYMGEAVVLRGGELATVPTLEEVESLEFPPPVGRCEAFATLGGTSTLPWTLRGRVRELDYKTVRYPGHAAKIRLLKQLGYFDEAPLAVEGRMLAPRALSAALLTRALTEEGVRDLVVFRVEALGETAAGPPRPRVEMIAV